MCVYKRMSVEHKNVCLRDLKTHMRVCLCVCVCVVGAKEEDGKGAGRAKHHPRCRGTKLAKRDGGNISLSVSRKGQRKGRKKGKVRWKYGQLKNGS